MAFDASSHSPTIGAPFVVTTIMVILIAAAALWHRRTHDNATNGADWRACPSSSTGTSMKSNANICTPTTLLAYRGIVFLYLLGVQLGQLVNVGAHFYLVFTAFTVWNFTLQITYFGVATWLSYHAWRRRSEEGVYDDEEEGDEASRVPLEACARIQLVLLEIEMPVSIVVCVVTWGVLYPIAIAEGNTGILLNFFSYTQHGLNVLLLAIEFLLNSIMVRRSHWSFMVLLIVAYATFHLCWEGSGHRSIYPFLSTQRWACLIWYIGLLSFHIFIFFLIYALSTAKARLCSLSLEPQPLESPDTPGYEDEDEDEGYGHDPVAVEFESLSSSQRVPRI